MPKKDKLNLVSAHIQLSAAIQSVFIRKIKMQVTLKQTAAQKQAKRVVRTMLCRKLRVIPSRMMNKDDDDDNVPSQNWHASVGTTVIAMYH